MGDGRNVGSARLPLDGSPPLHQRSRTSLQQQDSGQFRALDHSRHQLPLRGQRWDYTNFPFKRLCSARVITQTVAAGTSDT